VVVSWWWDGGRQGWPEEIGFTCNCQKEKEKVKSKIK
jgi:hypothetical protein